VKLFRAQATSSAAASSAAASSHAVSSHAASSPAVTAFPGTVVAVDASGVHVAAGEGVVVLRELQVAGRKRMPAAQFAAGRAIAVGDVLARPETA
jgi:methionyl-tRNA formyltransferase